MERQKERVQTKKGKEPATKTATERKQQQGEIAIRTEHEELYQGRGGEKKQNQQERTDTEQENEKEIRRTSEKYSKTELGWESGQIKDVVEEKEHEQKQNGKRAKQQSR